MKSDNNEIKNPEIDTFIHLNNGKNLYTNKKERNTSFELLRMIFLEIHY